MERVINYFRTNRRFLPRRHVNVESLFTTTNRSCSIKVNFDDWVRDVTSQETKDEINQLVSKFLTYEGFSNANKIFLKDSLLNKDGDSICFMDSIRISIAAGNVSTARREIMRNFPSLLHNKKELKHKMIIQELIELVRQDLVEEAIYYAQTYLSRICEEDKAVMEEAQSVLLLLVIKNPPQNGELAKIMDVDRRAMLAAHVVHEMSEYLEISSESDVRSLYSCLGFVQDQLNQKKVEYPEIKNFYSSEIKNNKDVGN